MNSQELMSPEAYEALCRILSREYGVDLRRTNPAVAQRKIHKFLGLHGLSSMAECLEFLRADSRRLQGLADIVYSQSTHFNRESEHFQFLVDTVLRQKRQHPESHSDQLEVWCPGCSTGQEAYTVAIYLMESVFPASPPSSSFHVLGSDCSESSLLIAQEGRYRVDDVQKLAPIPYRKYFVDAGDGHMSVRPEVRRQVSFSQFNLITSEYEFEGDIDYVFLRNALDFHTQESRKAILTQIRRTLKDGGYLVLGAFPTVTSDSPGRGFELAAPGCYRAISK